MGGGGGRGRAGSVRLYPLHRQSSAPAHQGLDSEAVEERGGWDHHYAGRILGERWCLEGK